ncbi:hypothetical protein P0E20_004272 [Vibrio harveyi]|nr:hypothetical protein [Vibrio harveyi]ELC3158210.1 hypothetical protein [Vibrio harveyi]
MWLIEFITGHLNGVTIPLESSLYLTGSTESELENVLALPEYLSEDTSLTLEVEGEQLYAQGFFHKGKRKVLVANRVCQYKGLVFFAYPQGKRAPKLRRYRLKQYQLLVVISLVLNALLSIGGVLWWQSHQTALIAKYWKQIDSGYVKGDHLYVYDPAVLEKLPHYLSANMTVIAPSTYLSTSQLSVEVVSSETGQTLPSSITTKKGRDQIRVHTKVVDNQIMSLFGQSGVSFVKKGQAWEVSDFELASRVLKAHGLDRIAKHLKVRNDDYERIDSNSFPYGIFFSTHSAGYIYDAANRYWEGSLVPKLGVIQTITREKVVFKDGLTTRIYGIPKL